MSAGAFDPRDFDKYMWTAPIPKLTGIVADVVNRALPETAMDDLARVR